MHFKQTPLVFLCCALLAIACNNEPKTPPPANPLAGAIKVDTVTSVGAATYKLSSGVVNWSGTHTIDKDGHQGTITIKEGDFLVNKGQLLSGKALLDMQSVSVNDIKDPGERRDLESHLKDSDFFEAKKYPTAEFVFTEVLPSTMPDFNWVLHGTLTMKGKSATVNIPARITIKDDELNAETPSFPINRTQWGVNFHSGILGTAKDKMIDDMVPISIKLSAKKAK